MHIAPHDNANSAIVDVDHPLVPLCYFNIVRLRAGEAFVSLGTSGVLFAANDGYQPDPETAVHTFCHAVKIITDGGYFNTWANTPKEKRLTWKPDAKSKFEPTTFDYIFTEGLKQTDAVMLEVPGGISDHSPVSISVEKL